MKLMDMKVEVPQVVTKDELKIALLENNKEQLKQIGDLVEHSADKIVKANNERTEPLFQTVTAQATMIGTLQEKVNTHGNQLNGLWSKMIGIGAACATVGGGLAIIIEQLIYSHK